MSLNIQNSQIVSKNETMDKRDLARLLDYYRMRVGKNLKHNY
jgi:hypothetical protein